MRSLERVIREEDLMVQVWWESGDSKFRAVVRKGGEVSDGWFADADNVIDAISLAVSIYQHDTRNAS